MIIQQHVKNQKDLKRAFSDHFSAIYFPQQTILQNLFFKQNKRST